MLKPLVPKFQHHLSVRLKDLAEKQISLKLRETDIASSLRSTEISNIVGRLNSSLLCVADMYSLSSLLDVETSVG